MAAPETKASEVVAPTTPVASPTPRFGQPAEVVGAITPVAGPTPRFGQPAIVTLTDADFNTDDDVLHIGLKPDHKDCYIIYFHTGDPTSIKQIEVFGRAAQEAVGPVFAVVNVREQGKVATAFTRLASDGNSPLAWAAKGLVWPTILVYRNTRPVAFYRIPAGGLVKEQLVAFALSQACASSYYNADRTPTSPAHTPVTRVAVRR